MARFVVDSPPAQVLVRLSLLVGVDPLLYGRNGLWLIPGISGLTGVESASEYSCREKRRPSC